MKIKKIVLGIVICIIILLSFVAVKEIKEIFDDAIITKYDINGNEIYSYSGKGSNKNYWKYNEKNQIIEYKSVVDIKPFERVDYIYYEYENDLLVKRISKSDKSPTDEDCVVLFEYNDKGVKTKEIDSLNGMTVFEYDDNSYLIKKIDPNNVITNYSYDENGNCTCEESSDGSIRKMEYDDEERIIKRTYINDPFYGNRTVRWEYFDDDPNISVKSYNNGEFASNYMVYDKNDEYIETGWKLDDGIAITKYKKITLYTRWKNGQIKSKRVYTLYKKDCFEKK